MWQGQRALTDWVEAGRDMGVQAGCKPSRAASPQLQTELQEGRLRASRVHRVDILRWHPGGQLWESPGPAHLPPAPAAPHPLPQLPRSLQRGPAEPQLPPALPAGWRAAWPRLLTDKARRKGLRRLQ